jgi:20S proteasome alpha/beta subunit
MYYDKVSDGILLAASGCLSDTLELNQVLLRNSKLYKWENGKSISVNAMSHLLAFILYSRRSFPCKLFIIC